MEQMKRLEGEVLDTAAGVPRLLAHNLDEHVTALTRR